MLSGQHLGGGEQHRLVSGVDHLQHGTQRHEGLAGADLALQEPLHGGICCEIGADGLANLFLALGEGEWQPGVEGSSDAVVTMRAGWRPAGCRHLTTVCHRHLGGDGLLPQQTFGTLGGIGDRRGTMHPFVGLRERCQISLRDEPVGQSVVQSADLGEHEVDGLGDGPGGQLGAGRVQTHQSVAHHLAGHGLLVGAPHHLTGLVEHDEIGVGELGLVTKRGHLAHEDAVAGDGELLAPVGHQPFTAEERHGQGGPAVGEGDLQALPGTGSGPAGDVVDLDPGDVGDERHLGAHDEVGEVGVLGAGEVSAWQVAEQVADVMHTQDVEGLGGSVAQHRAQGPVQFLLGTGQPRDISHGFEVTGQ